MTFTESKRPISPSSTQRFQAAASSCFSNGVKDRDAFRYVSLAGMSILENLMP